jgi:hypothetical protein
MDRVSVLSRLIVAVVVVGAFGLVSVRAEADDKGAVKSSKKEIKKEDFRYDGKPFSYWQSYWKTELKAERRIDTLWAMAGFGSRGYAAEATEVVLEMLKEFSPERISYSPMPTTPDEKIVNAIHEAIVKIGPEAAVILVRHLDHDGVRTLAGNVYVKPRLEWPGPARQLSASSVPLLIDKIQVKQKETREAAAWILSYSLSESAWIAFQEAMADEKKAKAIATALATFNDSVSAVRILSALGPKARPALSLLLQESLGDEDCDPHGTVASARATLAEIKPTPAELLPGLTQALIADPRMQVNAAKKLAEIGKPGRSAIPALLKAANAPVSYGGNSYGGNDCSEARLAQIDALEKLGAEKKDVLAAIQRLLTSTECGSFRQQALKRFLRLDENPANIVAVLTKVLEREPSVNRLVSVLEAEMAFDHEAMRALGKQGSGARPAVPVLLKTYESRYDDTTHTLVIETLGKIGPDAKAALPLLNQVLQGQNAELRRAAAQAIEAITHTRRKK